MSRYPLLPDHIREALASITPTRGGSLSYYPCRVSLKDGSTLNTVYIEPEKPYLRCWGVYQENDRGKWSVRIEDVLSVEDSPTRLPAQFANEVYDAGESGMGFTIFTVEFADGRTQAYATGNAVDFIRYPTGCGPEDVVAVKPHQGRNANPVSAPQWFWCLYSEEED